MATIRELLQQTAPVRGTFFFQGNMWWLILIVLSGICATIIVNATGGTKYSYVHLAYVPVLLSAVIYGTRGGLAAGLSVGLLMGPMMPLDVMQNVSQPPSSWLIRLVFFTLVGGGFGAICTAMRREMEQALQDSHTDKLTGLPTQLYFESVSFAGMVVGESVHAVVFHDVPRISATFGSISADVERAAARLLKGLSCVDQIFRIAPGTFIVLAERSQGPVVATAARQLVTCEHGAFFLNATVGTSLVRAGDTAQHALLHALSAASAARDLGLESAEYSWEDEEERRCRFALLGELRQAIEGDDLFLVYQPKVRLSDNEVVSCEALLRWKHPERGTVPPDEFIPLAEYSSLIGPLSLKVIDMAIAQLKAWEARGISVPVAVNVSVRNLMDNQFTETVIERLADNKLPLTLEITESAAANPSHDVFKSMQALTNAGIELHIDDYGTGMAGLAYLKRVPATQIKIDQMFIRHCVTDRRDRAMVRSTIALCRELDLIVVAEGVEDEATASLLNEMGCHHGQGYYFARPASADETANIFGSGTDLRTSREIITVGHDA